MNKVIIIGRLTRDPEVRYTQDQMSISRFTVAVDRRIKTDGQQNADFISCIAFGKTAEFTEKFARKGVKFGIEGRIQTGSYTNKDGQKVYTTDVVVEHMEFAESKGNGAPAGSAPVTDENGFVSVPDSINEELPF